MLDNGSVISEMTRPSTHNKQREKLSSGVILVLDKERQHTAAKDKEKIQDFQWNLKTHEEHCQLVQLSHGELLCGGIKQSGVA